MPSAPPGPLITGRSEERAELVPDESIRDTVIITWLLRGMPLLESKNSVGWMG